MSKSTTGQRSTSGAIGIAGQRPPRRADGGLVGQEDGELASHEWSDDLLHDAESPKTRLRARELTIIPNKALETTLDRDKLQEPIELGHDDEFQPLSWPDNKSDSDDSQMRDTDRDYEAPLKEEKRLGGKEYSSGKIATKKTTEPIGPMDISDTNDEEQLGSVLVIIGFSLQG
ncbi:uncharacterized protein BDZ99DRAFT_480761 [Mytilinidion resinicola]|uniref:Uncharacterized protein n=1 Tax=Mytilinidion resinicola TaxID=574789 RepID=A0A6A6Y989_9PEZI|nr:uncharacterized protein BDZ99DRAFT_480761 [Mytilinidion resinicola]KAF2805382.1 hypothetical protein BDZ99DRAFT_480761 [Mytilinidion resinicola]